MTSNGFLQIGLYLGILLVCVKPLGSYIAKIYSESERSFFLERIFGRFERILYRISVVDRQREMTWRQYAAAVLMFSFVGLLMVYGIQRLQAYLPLNPETLPNVSPDSSFNTAVSFITNTNWQGYGGRNDHELSDADARTYRAEFRVGGGRHGRVGRFDSWFCPASFGDYRQLLGRFGAWNALYPAADVVRACCGFGFARSCANILPLSMM